MRNYFLAFLFAVVSLTSLSAFADIEGAPFLPESDKRFDAIEQGNHIPQGIYPAGSADGHYVQQYIKATYDFSKHGGSSTVVHDLGVSLPASSIETRSWFYVVTKPTTSASGTLAFYCGNSSNPDIKLPLAAASWPAAGAMSDGIQSGAAANFSTVSSKCNVTAKIGTGDLTAGKVVLYVEYAVHQ